MSAVVLDIAHLTELASSTPPNTSTPSPTSRSGIANNNKTVSVRMADAISAAILLTPKSFSLRKSEMTVNTQHWRADSSEDPKRDRIYVTVLHKDVVARASPVVHLVVEKVYGEDGGLCGPVVSIVPPPEQEEEKQEMRIGEHAIKKFRTMTTPTLAGVSLAVIDPANPGKQIPLEVNGQPLSAYSTLLSTTLTGHTLTLLLEDVNTLASANANQNDDASMQSEHIKYLAAMRFVPGEGVRVRPVALGNEHPVMQALAVECYSGAVVFATEAFESVVVKFFD